MKTSDQLVVTGGLGFIGSNLIRSFAASGEDVICVDLATYASDPRRLSDIADRYRSIRIDVSSMEILDIARHETPRVIVHMAAESHVTRGETAAETFMRTNVEGTRRVLEAAEQAGAELLVHVSTDEVYGPCEADPFSETDKLPGVGNATSTYARSKALADDLAASASEHLPVIVVRPTNCFGPYQHPEKAVARWSIRAARGERLPVWGDGGQVRDWMYVEDCCNAIRLLIDKGTPGEVYNIGPEGAQISNLELAKAIARAAGRPESDVYLTAYDRPQHDRRYAIDASKLRALGWHPTRSLEERLAETVDWYRRNEDWWGPLLEDAETLYKDDQERAL